MSKLVFKGVTAVEEAGAKDTKTFAHTADNVFPDEITSFAKKERAQDVNLLAIGRAHNRNMQIMGRTPEYLYKGMKEGKPIEELFMIAVRGVAACLNDPMLEKVMTRGLEERREKSKEINEME